MNCPKCGPKPDRPGPNPAWIIPAVAEQVWADLTTAVCKYECTYCGHKWDGNAEEDSFKMIQEVIEYIEYFILCDTLSDQQRAVLMEKLKDLVSK